MRAEELRINNIIYLTKDNFKTVNEYTLTGFDIYKLEDNDCADIKPIPLTEEWLLKFDIINKNTIELKGGDIFLKLENNEVGICGADSCTSGMIFYAKCEFVHQLQNLYFALTGEELTIKTK